MVEDNYVAEWFEANVGDDHRQGGPKPLKQDFTTLEDYYVAKLIWQTEMLLGTLSRETCEVVGDDDRSILEHNFACIIREALSD